MLTYLVHGVLAKPGEQTPMRRQEGARDRVAVAKAVE